MYTSLVLSGNSTNAMVSLGALQYLSDNNMIHGIKKYFGTSSGTILSLLLIVGYKPIELLTFICTEKVYKKMGGLNLTNIFLTGKPLMSFEPIKEALELLIVEKLGYTPTMRDLKEHFDVEFTVTTYNLTDDKREYINHKTHPDLSVISAIRMSSSYPLLFEPYCCDGKLYLDGGIVDNFPIERTDPNEKSLGVITLNPQKKYSHELNNIDFALKLLQIFIQTVTIDKIKRTKNCDIIVLDTHSAFFNFDSTNNEIIAMFDKGYALCRQVVEEGTTPSFLMLEPDLE